MTFCLDDGLFCVRAFVTSNGTVRAAGDDLLGLFEMRREIGFAAQLGYGLCSGRQRRDRWGGDRHDDGAEREACAEPEDQSDKNDDPRLSLNHDGSFPDC